MQVLDFLFVHFPCSFDPVHKLLNSGLPFFKSINVISLDSLKFFVLGLQYFVLLVDKLFEFFLLSSHPLNYIFEPGLHFCDILGVNFSQSFFERVKLDFVLPFDLVNLFFQNVYLFVHFLPLFLSLLVGCPQLPQKPLNFVIFYSDQFPQAVHLYVEQFSLVLLRFVDVLELKVEHLFKLFLHLLDFVILLLNSLFAFRLEVLHGLPEPGNLFIFLLPDFFNPIFHDCFDVLFFINDFFETSDLELVFFFLFVELPFGALDFPSDFKGLFIFNFEDDLHFGLFGFLGSFFPSVEFVLHLQQPCLPIHAFGFLVLDCQLKLLKLGFGLAELLIFVIEV